MAERPAQTETGCDCKGDNDQLSISDNDGELVEWTPKLNVSKEITQ